MSAPGRSNDHIKDATSINELSSLLSGLSLLTSSKTNNSKSNEKGKSTNDKKIKQSNTAQKDDKFSIISPSKPRNQDKPASTVVTPNRALSRQNAMVDDEHSNISTPLKMNTPQASSRKNKDDNSSHNHKLGSVSKSTPNKSTPKSISKPQNGRNKAPKTYSPSTFTSTPGPYTQHYSVPPRYNKTQSLNIHPPQDQHPSLTVESLPSSLSLQLSQDTMSHGYNQHLSIYNHDPTTTTTTATMAHNKSKNKPHQHIKPSLSAHINMLRTFHHLEMLTVTAQNATQALSRQQEQHEDHHKHESSSTINDENKLDKSRKRSSSSSYNNLPDMMTSSQLESLHITLANLPPTDGLQLSPYPIIAHHTPQLVYNQRIYKIQLNKSNTYMRSMNLSSSSSVSSSSQDDLYTANDDDDDDSTLPPLPESQPPPPPLQRLLPTSFKKGDYLTVYAAPNTSYGRQSIEAYNEHVKNTPVPSFLPATPPLSSSKSQGDACCDHDDDGTADAYDDSIDPESVNGMEKTNKNSKDKDSKIKKPRSYHAVVYDIQGHDLYIVIDYKTSTQSQNNRDNDTNSAQPSSSVSSSGAIPPPDLVCLLFEGNTENIYKVEQECLTIVQNRFDRLYNILCPRQSRMTKVPHINDGEDDDNDDANIGDKSIIGDDNNTTIITDNNLFTPNDDIIAALYLSRDLHEKYLEMRQAQEAAQQIKKDFVVADASIPSSVSASSSSLLLHSNLNTTLPDRTIIPNDHITHDDNTSYNTISSIQQHIIPFIPSSISSSLNKNQRLCFNAIIDPTGTLIGDKTTIMATTTPELSEVSTTDTITTASKPTINPSHPLLRPLSSRHPLFTIEGPPGTGKSRLLNAIIGHSLQQGKRVLLSSHSNHAVDHLLGLFAESYLSPKPHKGKSQPIQFDLTDKIIVRLGSPLRMDQNVLSFSPTHILFHLNQSITELRRICQDNLRQMCQSAAKKHTSFAPLSSLSRSNSNSDTTTTPNGINRNNIPQSVQRAWDELYWSLISTPTFMFDTTHEINNLTTALGEYNTTGHQQQRDDDDGNDNDDDDDDDNFIHKLTPLEETTLGFGEYNDDTRPPSKPKNRRGKGTPQQQKQQSVRSLGITSPLKQFTLPKKQSTPQQSKSSYTSNNSKYNKNNYEMSYMHKGVYLDNEALQRFKVIGTTLIRPHMLSIQREYIEWSKNTANVTKQGNDGINRQPSNDNSLDLFDTIASPPLELSSSSSSSSSLLHNHNLPGIELTPSSISLSQSLSTGTSENDDNNSSSDKKNTGKRIPPALAASQVYNETDAFHSRSIRKLYNTLSFLHIFQNSCLKHVPDMLIPKAHLVCGTLYSLGARILLPQMEALSKPLPSVPSKPSSPPTEKSTLSSSQPQSNDHAVVDPFFDLVIIDEVSQCSEMSLMAALSLGKKVIVAGDHCQLSPIVLHPQSIKQGYGISLLERISHGNSQYLLNNNDIISSTCSHDDDKDNDMTCDGHFDIENSPLVDDTPESIITDDYELDSPNRQENNDSPEPEYTTLETTPTPLSVDLPSLPLPSPSLLSLDPLSPEILDANGSTPVHITHIDPELSLDTDHHDYDCPYDTSRPQSMLENDVDEPYDDDDDNNNNNNTICDIDQHDSPFEDVCNQQQQHIDTSFIVPTTTTGPVSSSSSSSSSVSSSSLTSSSSSSSLTSLSYLDQQGIEYPSSFPHLGLIPSVTLTQQYRMNKVISDWVSTATYSQTPLVPGTRLVASNTLISSNDFNKLCQYPATFHSPLLWINTKDVAHSHNKQSASQQRQQQQPSLSNTFINQYNMDTLGKESFSSHSYSYTNIYEAYLALQHTIRLLDCGIDQKRITIIAPYAAQVSLLSSICMHYCPYVSVGTVDSMQGAENDIVIYTSTRSNNNHRIGFLNNIKRLNVALSRAKQQIVIIGDSKTITSSTYLSQLYQYKHLVRINSLQYIKLEIKSNAIIYKESQHNDNQMSKHKLKRMKEKEQKQQQQKKKPFSNNNNNNNKSLYSTKYPFFTVRSGSVLSIPLLKTLVSQFCRSADISLSEASSSNRAPK